MTRTPWLVALVVIGGCTATRAPGADASAQATGPVDVDLLLVVDDSNGFMKEHGARLGRSVPAFVETMGARLGVLHLGVASQDAGAGLLAVGCRPGGKAGVLQARAACGLPPGQRFVVRQVDGSSNSMRPFDDTMACLAELGVDGCGFEQPLHAGLLALAPAQTANAGFLRPDAHLVVVFLMDEDDCSMPADSTFAAEMPQGVTSDLHCATDSHACDGRSVEPRVASFPVSSCRALSRSRRLFSLDDLVGEYRKLKGDPNRLTVAAIAGAAAGSEYSVAETRTDDKPLLMLGRACRALDNGATIGLRLQAFTEAFGARGMFTSICDADFTSPMSRLGAMVAAAADPLRR